MKTRRGKVSACIFPITDRLRTYKTMNRRTVLFAVAAGFIAAACGTENNEGTKPGGTTAAEGTGLTAGEVVEKGFEHIETDGDFDLFYATGKEVAVRFEGNRDDIARIIVKNDGHTLRFTQRGENLNDVDVYVTSPRLEGVTLEGSGDITSESSISAGTFDIRSSGSGDVQIHSVTADRISAELRKSGDISLNIADADEIDYEVSGSGDITTERISADRLEAKVSGSGDIDLSNARIDEAECTITGSGDIDIDGHVGRCTKNVTGSGVVDINP